MIIAAQHRYACTPGKDTSRQHKASEHIPRAAPSRAPARASWHTAGGARPFAYRRLSVRRSPFRAERARSGRRLLPLHALPAAYGGGGVGSGKDRWRHISPAAGERPREGVAASRWRVREVLLRRVRRASLQPQSGRPCRDEHPHGSLRRRSRGASELARIRRLRGRLGAASRRWAGALRGGQATRLGRRARCVAAQAPHPQRELSTPSASVQAQRERPTAPTAPRRPTHPTHATQPTQFTHPMQPTHAKQPLLPRPATTAAEATTPALSSTPALPSTPAPATVPALPTTPALATVPALPITPALATVPALPTTPALAMVPALPITPALATLPALPTTPVLLAAPAPAWMPAS